MRTGRDRCGITALGFWRRKGVAARVSAQHQKLLHFVANAEWSDEQMLAKVRDLVTPSATMPEQLRCCARQLP
jgi:SRSO17 transposase